MSTKQHPCTHCGRPLSPTGELVVDGVVCPVYQCDDCTETVLVEGVEFEAAVTFAVGPRGPFNPADDCDDDDDD